MNTIKTADEQYNEHALDILHNGSYVQDRTGTGALKRWSKKFLHRPLESFPILTSKKVAFETAKKELFWIYQDQSNDVNLLREKYGVNVWNEWADVDGTIGKAYGYQVKKHNQIDRLIDGLINDPYSRRHRMNLWSEEDAPEMQLQPCAFMTLWYVEPVTQELHMTLIQRSGDWGLGIPFNMAQYAVLHCMIAHCTGYKVGNFEHIVNDAHIYVDHINPIRKQLSRGSRIGGITDNRYTYSGQLLISTEQTDFYKIKPEELRLIGYESHDHISMKVSV